MLEGWSESAGIERNNNKKEKGGQEGLKVNPNSKDRISLSYDLGLLRHLSALLLTLSFLAFLLTTIIIVVN